MRRALVCLALLAACSGPRRVVVGSKAFTESVILGEIATGLLRGAEIPVQDRKGLGGTRVLWKALLRGDIDVYPEYTGTMEKEIYAGKPLAGGLAAALARDGVAMSRPLGFQDTYALGMREARARELGIRTIDDLARHPGLVYGFSNEFLDRADGWPGLSARYGLKPGHVSGLDHDLSYKGLVDGSIDVTDVYTTDAEIGEYGLRVLKDDRGYFPRYDAVLLYRKNLSPEAVQALRPLEGALSESTMIALNAAVKRDHQSESAVAAGFLRSHLDLSVAARRESLWSRLLQRTIEHVTLVAIALFAAIAVAVPLGILAARRRRLGQAVLAITGVFQTIPSLALFVFLIPLLGIGGPPAIVAIFLYSLLPIVRNTHAGLRDIPLSLRESAEALGLGPLARLRFVELPLALPSILAGIKTAAVISVGTATIAALIGAGGYGQPILTGIRLDDLGLTLQGAIPAAVLALLVQGAFDLLERGIVSPGLRLESQRPPQD